MSANIDINHRLGCATNDTKEESLSIGNDYLRTLPLEEGDCECTHALTSYGGHEIFPKLIATKAFGNTYHENLTKLMRALLKAF